MDGPFYSVYPFEDGTATLYGVEWSRLAKCYSAQEARHVLDRMSVGELDHRRRRMESGVSRWFPAFLDQYKFDGWHGAVRAISTDKSDARVCRVRQEGETIHVLSGKIDSIFYAEQEVLKCLGFS